MEYIDKLVDEPLANWEIKKPSETVILRQIPVANVEPCSSIYSIHDATLLKITNNTYPGKKIVYEPIVYLIKCRHLDEFIRIFFSIV